MNKLKQLWLGVSDFFNSTKLGQLIKSGFVTFTGIFFGILVATPAINSLFHVAYPTIHQLKDLAPVALDALYRAVWAFIGVETGLYKYNSSTTEKSNPVIIPTK